ncbi:GIY-YIG nuclease family protein [Candidatus Woesebacteria bacterium]|nr:MAG: GIY-YIG nuclease family protein [Candidatus Woesebacteria bacterium]
MFHTYVLIVSNGNFYIGYTKDLRKRFHNHVNGLVYSTKTKLPVVLVYYEACINEYDAIKRERYLKSGPGRKFIKYRIRYYLNKITPGAS